MSSVGLQCLLLRAVTRFFIQAWTDSCQVREGPYNIEHQHFYDYIAGKYWAAGQGIAVALGFGVMIQSQNLMSRGYLTL